MTITTHEFLFRQIAEGIVIVDSEGTLVRFNPAAAMILRITSDAIGKPITEVFSGQRKLQKLFSSSEGLDRAELRLYNSRLIHAQAADVEEGRAVILNDVTEKHDLESRREALIGTISHDLRNPISGLGGFAELVEKFGDLNQQQLRFVTRIKQTSSKLYEMTDKLVDLAWIEAGMPLEHVPVELTSLTREVIKELTHLAEKQRVSIVNSIPDELPTLMGDPHRLRQLIYNLLDNAIRYSLNGGNVVVHAWHQDDRVYYTVADQGIGIAEEDRDRIWDRMWRSSDQRVLNISGGGVGLTFVKTLVKRLGGEIELEQTSDQGSTFTLILPLLRA